MASESWEGATNKDGSWFYWDLIKMVFKESNILLKYEIAPYVRTVNLTKLKKIDGWVGSYENEQSFAIYPEYNFDVDHVYSISKKGLLVGLGENSIKNNEVAWIRGYNYDKYLNIPLKKVEVSNRYSGIQMVLFGRVDAFLDDKEEIEIIIKNKKLKKTDFKIQKIIPLKIYIAFANTPKGKELAKIWDTNIKKLRKSGKLRTFYIKEKYSNYPF